MRRKISEIIIMTLAAILFPVALIAASIEVSWNANTEADLAGYKIHYGTQTGSYTSTLNAGKVTTTSIDNLQTGSTYYLAITAYDNDANESGYSQEVSIAIPIPDTTPPTGSIIINANAARASSRTITLSLSASDAAGTVESMKISNDGVTWSAEAPFTASQAWVLTTGDGVKTVYAVFKDNSGNWMSTPATDTIELLLDSDGDGMPDVWENTNGLNPSNAADAGIDTDNDGYNNFEEYTSGSNPNYRYDYAPIVEAGTSKQSDPTRIYLNGSASYDPNGDSLSYSWTQVSGPQATLENPSSSNASFMGIKSGTYRFMLSCSDGRATSTDTVDIIINNLAPSVNAGNDMTIDSGSSITLQATGADANDDTLTFAWTRLEGPAISLPALNTQNITLTPQNAGQYRFSVACSDGVNTSEADEIILIVNAVNQAPTADAGDDADVELATLVVLDGSRSTDPDNDQLTYIWKQLSGPQVALADALKEKASFNAAVTGTYIFELSVSDAAVSSIPDTVTIRVLAHNMAPIADAGADQLTKVGTVVSLNASSSYDPDNHALTYSWTQTQGASVQMYGMLTSKPTFTPTVSGVLEFKVVVSDGQAASEDMVTVTVESINRVPVAEAGEAQTLTLPMTFGGKIILDGSLSSDPDGDTLTFIWSQLSGPGVSLTGANTVNPSFTPTVAGTYVFELKASDGKDMSTADTVTITVQNIQTVINLSSPQNGSQISSAPTLKWSGVNVNSYSLYMALNGKTYVKMYSGSSTSYSVHSILWYWFIPKRTTVSWYVQGQDSSAQQITSSVFTFKKS